MRLCQGADKAHSHEDARVHEPVEGDAGDAVLLVRSVDVAYQELERQREELVLAGFLLFLLFVCTY